MTARRSFAAVLLACFATLASAAAEAAPSLRRGVNISPWLYKLRSTDGSGTTFTYPARFPNFGEFTPATFATLKGLGLDFIRIPVEPNPFLAAPPHEIPGLLAQVDRAVDIVNAAGLTAIVDLHPWEDQPQWKGPDILGDPDLSARYAALVQAVAAELARKPNPHVVLELMNEPPGGFGHETYDWFRTQTTLVKAARAVAPTLPLLLSGNRGGSIAGLLRLDPRDIADPNTLFSFHYYEPIVFTSQGSSTGRNNYRRFVSGLNYPPTPEGHAIALATLGQHLLAAPPAAAGQIASDANGALTEFFDGGPRRIGKDFASVQHWAARYGIAPNRIVMGEFGVLRPNVPEDSAAIYLHDLRFAAETAGFGWAYFNYEPHVNPPAFSLNQLSGPTPDALDGTILTALGLRAAP